MLQPGPRTDSTAATAGGVVPAAKHAAPREVLAVVGAGHLQGMAKHLAEDDGELSIG